MNTKKCEQCSKKFITAKNMGERQRFCSKKCNRKWHNQNRVNKKHLKGYICKFCGKKFIPKASDRITYCSRNCAFSHKKQIAKQIAEQKRIEKAKRKKICSWCKKEFPYFRGKYCSNKCRLEKARVEQRDRSKKLFEAKRKPAVCKECKKEFLPEYGSKKRDFCSKKCCVKYGARAYRKSVNGKIGKFKARHKRRARLKKVKYENINPIEVYQTHDWVCGICGKKINPKLEYPHLKSATIDHIVPVARGGSHTYNNVQPAHFICNSYKSDKTESIQSKQCVAM